MLMGSETLIILLILNHRIHHKHELHEVTEAGSGATWRFPWPQLALGLVFSPGCAPEGIRGSVSFTTFSLGLSAASGVEEKLSLLN